MNTTRATFLRNIDGRHKTAEPGEPPTPIRHIRAGQPVPDDGSCWRSLAQRQDASLSAMDWDDCRITLEGDEPMSPRAREAWALMLGVGLGAVVGYLVGVALS